MTAAAPKPFVHPLTAPGGRTLSTVSPPDHAWHRGLWFAIKFVDGDNFWEEVPPFGRQVPAGEGRIDWVRPDGSVALVEERTVTRAPAAEGGEVVDWDSRLTAPSGADLDRTPYTTWGGYGGLAFRGTGDWTGTRILLADGSEHTRPEGVPARWCDLSGPDAGLAFLDHPGNPRHPVPWYGATRSPVYGEGWSNFVNAAFLFAEPLSLGPGDNLRFRYRVLVHDGTWAPDRVDAAWREWAQT